MKKTMLTMALLLTTMLASAQMGVKILPKYQKGDVANYVQKMVNKTQMMGQEATSEITIDLRYEITDATDGYTITGSVEKVDATSSDNSLMATIMSVPYRALQGTKICYKADADGHITDILNYDEVRTQIAAVIDNVYDELAKGMSEMASSLPKEQITEQVLAEVTKEKLLQQASNNASPFTLNGKTIMTGAMEDDVIEEGMKVRRMYFLTEADGSKVKVTTGLNMTQDELKEFIIDHVKKQAPEQAALVEQNIDMIMASGQMKFSADGEDDYEFGERGWVNKISSRQMINSMGAVVTIDGTLEKK